MEDGSLSRAVNFSLHRFAVLTAGATLVLIFAGGLVTSTGSALAIPDWPLAFGKLIPALEGGVRFEYGHRVVAGIVVILMLVLMTWTWMGDARRWVWNTALAAFGLIIVQAVLGGVTVLLELPLEIAVLHAAVAQAFFCLTVALAAFTNPWFAATERRNERPVRLPTAFVCALATGVIYLQIIIGALMRHLGAGLAIPDFPASFGRAIPPVWDEFIAVNFAHRASAVIVICLILWAALRILRVHGGEPRLRRPAQGLLLLLAAQLVLGAFTIWSGRAVLPTTAHVAVGAAVLAASLTLTIRVWRMFGLRRAVAEPVICAADGGGFLKPKATV